MAASNRSLAEMVEQKLFRADLFYRLSGVDVARADAPRAPAATFSSWCATSSSGIAGARPAPVAPMPSHALTEYEWPGNVRELERLVERVVALAHSDVIELDGSAADGQRRLRRVAGALSRPERHAARLGHPRTCLIVERVHGNKREACRALGISYHTLQAYLKAADADTACRGRSGARGRRRERRRARYRRRPSPKPCSRFDRARFRRTSLVARVPIWNRVPHPIQHRFARTESL